MWKWLSEWVKSWFVKKPDPQPEVEEDADEIDLATCKFFEASSEVATWKKVNSISQVWMDNLFRWATKKPIAWKNVNGIYGAVWCFLKQPDGTWYASPGDSIRPGENYKNEGDIKIYIGNNVVLRPKDGEEMGVMFSTLCRHNVYKNGKERTNTKKFIWKRS